MQWGKYYFELFLCYEYLHGVIGFVGVIERVGVVAMLLKILE